MRTFLTILASLFLLFCLKDAFVLGLIVADEWGTGMIPSEMASLALLRAGISLYAAAAVLQHILKGDPP